MKRALYEWTGILGALAAAACVAYWGASFFVNIPGDIVDLRVRGSGASPRISLSDGTLAYCSDNPSLAALANPELFFKGPAVASPIEYLGIRFVRLQDRDSPAYALGFTLPGVRYAHCDIDFFGQPTFIWQARVSMAIVSFAILSLAALSWWRYRMVCRKPHVLVGAIPPEQAQ